MGPHKDPGCSQLPGRPHISQSHPTPFCVSARGWQLYRRAPESSVSFIPWTPVRSQVTCSEPAQLIGGGARIGTQIHLIPQSALSPIIAAAELGVSSSGKQEKAVPGPPAWSGEERWPSAESGSCGWACQRGTGQKSSAYVGVTHWSLGHRCPWP